MKPDELRRKFPRASAAFIAANSDAGSARTTAVVEPSPRNGALAKKKAQGLIGPSFHVRVESVRNRLLDEDNLCEKFHVDLLRYAGVIPGDSPAEVSIETRQRKAEKGEEERVIITVTPLR